MYRSLGRERLIRREEFWIRFTLVSLVLAGVVAVVCIVVLVVWIVFPDAPGAWVVHYRD